jgi:hypothetical protein
LLNGRPGFESRLGTPEEALYRAESNEENKSSALRVVYIKILYICSTNVKINRKSGSVPPNLKMLKFTHRIVIKTKILKTK